MNARTVGLKCCGKHQKILERVFIPAHVPCAMIFFEYNVYIIPILLDTKNVKHLKHAFVLLI